ncbi:MAG: class II aldolase/adducin family protein [Planctomycetota bacterium]|nr:class II aldolase/adducin family protein [Planctomycetota bacterium]
MTTRADSISSLLQLAHTLGKDDLRMSILGEGNVSIRVSDETFLVKTSGANLGSLSETGIAECRFDKLLPMIDSKGMDDAQIDQALFDARVSLDAKKPSVESLFHAWLLGLPGVQCVGHVHAIAVNQILCSPRAKEFARNRIFPDEIVCCGCESVFVPYTDPGLALAQVIRQKTLKFVARTKREPRIILLENHGVIAVGSSPDGVLASLLMVEKSAQIFVGSAALGGPNFLTAKQVQRIAGRPDEHYRQSVLKL